MSFKPELKNARLRDNRNASPAFDGSYLGRTKQIVGVILAAALLSGCNESWTWHQKITVSVITPDHVVTEANVMKAGIEEKGGWWAPPEATGATSSLSGEAVVLELSPNRYLFVLLKNLPGAYSVFFPEEAPLEVAEKLESMRDSRELTPRQYPMLVTFDDINNPTSVRRVDPDNLAAVFGPGYKLEFIMMSITDEPVTTGKVEHVLEWLCRYKEKRLRLSGLNGPIDNNEIANNISGTDFSNGECK